MELLRWEAVAGKPSLCLPLLLHLTFSGTWDQLDLLQGKKRGKYPTQKVKEKNLTAGWEHPEDSRLCVAHRPLAGASSLPMHPDPSIPCVRVYPG